MGESGQVVVSPGIGDVKSTFEARGMDIVYSGENRMEAVSASYYAVLTQASEADGGGVLKTEMSASVFLFLFLTPCTPVSHSFIRAQHRVSATSASHSPPTPPPRTSSSKPPGPRGSARPRRRTAPGSSIPPAPFSSTPSSARSAGATQSGRTRSSGRAPHPLSRDTSARVSTRPSLRTA